jgi:hypothetical protein
MRHSTQTSIYDRVPNGFIFYRGPSMLDGSPIVAIATRVTSASKNSKTGALVATYILRDDINPVDAVRQGKDQSICGSCVHRGWYDSATNSWKDRSCYVVIGQGPLGVYDGFERGIYPEVAPEQACEWLAGHAVRLGTYGDPCARSGRCLACHVAQGGREGWIHTSVETVPGIQAALHGIMRHGRGTASGDRARLAHVPDTSAF